ncbi:Flp family type IVb pilin, partial [Pedococcus sp. NPDC057267]|uniref:Flp family type IVb pilin n=1 Tax=Pedococcus sp. NPDC057267 TaxID=3346077 RepID=UPI00363E3C19
HLYSLRGVSAGGPGVRGPRGPPVPGRGDRGATAVEYAIMVSLIAVVIVSAVTLFGQNMIQLFQVPSSAL